MSKKSLALVSLVAAIPGLILTVMLVMNFLARSDKLTGMLWAVSIVTMLCSVFVMVLPVGVMLTGAKAGRDGDEEADKDAEPTTDETGEVSEPEIDGFSDDNVVAEAGDELSMDDDDFDDDVTATVNDDVDGDLFLEDDEDFGLEMDEDDEEEKR